MTTLRNFWDDESGATSIEYAFIASIVTAAIFAALTTMGGNLNAKFKAVATKLS